MSILKSIKNFFSNIFKKLTNIFKIAFKEAQARLFEELWDYAQDLVKYYQEKHSIMDNDTKHMKVADELKRIAYARGYSADMVKNSLIDIIVKTAVMAMKNNV